MKKLFSYATLFAFMALVAFSCKSEPDIAPDNGNGNGNGGEAIEGMGYFSMTLNTSAKGSGRAAQTEEGSEEEQIVKNVVILLYEPDDPDGVLRYKFELDAEKKMGDTEVFEGADVVTGGHAPAQPSTSRFVSKGKPVKYQDYQMVVMVNYKNMGPDIEHRAAVDFLNDYLEVDVSLLSEINDVAFEGTEGYYKRSVAGFFMSNANGVVPVKKTELGATAVAAETTPIAVGVDRIVAKVRAYHDWPNTWTPIQDDEAEASRWITDKGDVVTNVEYNVDKKPFFTYLIRKYADYATAQAGNNTAYTGMETWATTKLQSREFIYATDPNFTGMKDATQTELEDAFMSTDENSGGFSAVYSASNKQPFHGVYVLENTMNLDDQKHANWANYTSQLIVKAYITPKGFQSGASYYSFVNDNGDAKVFTHADIVGWIKDGLPPTLSVEMAGLLDKATHADCEFDFSETSSEGWYFETSNGITFHPFGVNVYRVPIKHFQPSSSMADPKSDLYGHYGVVRNNVYNVTIKNLTGPGTGANAYISADITVNDWFVRDWEEEL